MKRLTLVIILTSIYFQLNFTYANASFGVSPADLSFEYLSPGITVEKAFLLSRTDLDKEAVVVVETDIEGANDWVRVEPGVTFTIPSGIRTGEMLVSISVPKNAEYRNYKGYLTLKVAEGGQTAGVSIVEGVGISVDLSVTESAVANLLVRKLEIPPVIKGSPIRLLLTTENRGSKESSPEKVKIIVQDGFGNEVLRSEYADLENIEPGKTKVIAAVFDNKLSQGKYYADVSVEFLGKLIKEDKLYFSVEEKADEIQKKTEVIQGTGYQRALLFKLVLLSAIPATCIWIILRKKYKIIV